MAVSDTTIISYPEIYPGRERIRPGTDLTSDITKERKESRQGKPRYSTIQKCFLLNNIKCLSGTSRLIAILQMGAPPPKKKPKTNKQEKPGNEKANYHRKLTIR